MSMRIIYWVEEGDKLMRFFFTWRKNMDRINYKYGIGLKISDGKYKYDIDSILDEQIQFYSNLF